VSTDYYAQLERGNLAGVSDSVLDAIARALQLDEAEHAHLHDLAHAANTTPHTRRRATPKQPLRPVVQRILDGITAMPAIVMNVRLAFFGRWLLYICVKFQAAGLRRARAM